MTDDVTERARQARLVHDAVARGQAALDVGDRHTAIRWLDRAHRLAPADATVTLFLASALLGADNAASAALFEQVLASHDVRDGWLGLATTRFLMGDLPGVREALAAVLSRHALWPAITELADRTVHATGAAGWCGLTGEGVLAVHRADAEPIEIRLDGTVWHGPDLRLAPSWPRLRAITVTTAAGGEHLIGSPIFAGAIGRVEGHVEAGRRGIRGWAWCPGDPDTAPRLSVKAGGVRLDIDAVEPAEGIPGLAPLARPRSFNIPWRDLPEHEATVQVRGRDGRDLPVGPRATNTPEQTPGSLQPRAAVHRRGVGRWRGQDAGSVILMTHDDGGGVERRIEAAIVSHEAVGLRATVLRPFALPDGTAGVAVHGNGLPTLCYALPRERAALSRLLLGTAPRHVELHHFLNHDPSLFGIIQALGVPYDVHIHDYAWFCPRVALVGRGDRYCGEPDVPGCVACVTATGTYLHDAIGVPDLLKRSAEVLSGARRVIAPSHDAAVRISRHFPGVVPVVVPHEDDEAVDDPPPVQCVTKGTRVCIAGAIGLHKGFHILLACARDARKRGLDLSFVVVGTTIDDQRLLDTGVVFVTGAYQPEEAVDLIRAQDATLALLPSIWPETWCLGLTELWRAGLRVVAFDIGAPAERIRRTGRGFLLPLRLSPPRINDALLNVATGRSFLPIRRSSAYKPSH